MTAGQNDATRWRTPTREQGLSRLEILRRRHIVKKAVRAYFDAQDFIEIDAPLLVRGTTPDIAVESFAVGDRYLVTSTEYQMKRLAVGGVEKLYSLTQNFRRGDDTGAMRNPEFTMLEWGRVGQRMSAIETDAQNLVLAAMKALGLGTELIYQGYKIDMRVPWQRLSVAEAIKQVTGVDCAFDAASCAAALRTLKVELREDWLADGDFLFSLLMDEIQPHLGRDKPVFLTEWPLYQTTSAAAGEDETKAERSELFIAGIELSDGFAGLADADLQKQLFDYMQQKRAALGMGSVIVDENYLAAMKVAAVSGAGMAMGFDRLVMLLTDQAEIHNVLAFAWDEV